MRRAALALVPVVVSAPFLALALVRADERALAPSDAAPVASLTAADRANAERLIGGALADDTAYRRLEYLCDRIGNRLSGSAALERAVAWARSEMEKDGLENVRTEKVMVPHWVRGNESAELTAPEKRKLSMLGLGNSVGTPPGGLEADVVVARSFEELDALGENKVRGTIVLFDVPFTSYGETVKFRSAGPSRAAKLGAVAMLVRSVGPVSLRTPHTGTLSYDEALPKIPAAAVAIEDATLISRLVASGEKVRVRLAMEAHFLPDAESANVIGEVRGREKPDEVVLVCGHLDSWDVGQGANDDGGGCMVAWEAVRTVKRLGLRPRRTLRVVLYVNEENGTRGGKAYAEMHGAEPHVLAIECDEGVTRPTGLGLGKAATAAGRNRVREIGRLLAGIGADRIDPDGGGADIGPLQKLGVLVSSLNVDATHYFDVHHTEADTFDKVDRTELARCVAAMSVYSYLVADLPERLR